MSFFSPNFKPSLCTVLYCTALYSTVLYWTVLYWTVLYCTVMYCTALCCNIENIFTLIFHLKYISISWLWKYFRREGGGSILYLQLNACQSDSSQTGMSEYLTSLAREREFFYIIITWLNTALWLAERRTDRK